MKMVLDREEQIRGPHTPEAMQLKELFLKKVLPRYLRPLETGGRSIRPCLLHTDLWPGNVKYNKLDNETASVFDANGLWAHNEGMRLEIRELQSWELEETDLKVDLLGWSSEADRVKSN